LIEASFSQPMNIEAYAGHLRVSPRHLARIVKAVTRITPTQCLQQRRLLEAKRLLAYTQMDIAEVAYQVGIEDPSYFNRLFRKQEGQTPSAFRMSQVSNKMSG
jgi:AraC family transcriptional activator of pobA